MADDRYIGEAIGLNDLPSGAATDAEVAADYLAKAGGQMSGNITMSGAQTVDGRDLSVDGAKLDALAITAASAGTGTQVGLAEPTGGGTSVATLVAPALAGDVTITLPATTRNLGTDGTKLDGIAAGATAPIALLGAATSVTTTPYTVLAADTYLRCTAAASVIALEAAPATGRTLAIKNKTASDLTFSGATIDGSAAHTVAPDACRWLRWNGTDYDAI